MNRYLKEIKYANMWLCRCVDNQCWSNIDQNMRDAMWKTSENEECEILELNMELMFCGLNVYS